MDQRARIGVGVLSLAGLLPACSGADFQVAPADATIDATTDADAGSDATRDAPTDAVDGGDGCVKNACGGCALLLNNPGDSCGACGKYTCTSGGEAVTCTDPGKNACGGCGGLTAKPGDSCGSCGKQLCSASGSTLECKDPGLNGCGGCAALPGKPGNPCGGAACGIGTFACKGTEALECKGATTNECGGCGTLTGKVGDACGKCGSGKLVCKDVDSLRCDDPILSTATVGTPCSKCGTINWACNAGGTAIVCPGTDTNACDGCGTLGGTPGNDCLTCGVFKCATGGASVDCVGPTTGGTCGLCGTSTTVCDVRGVSTKCSKPDDRGTAVDLDWSGTDLAKFDLSRAVAHAIGYPLRKTGSVYQLTLRGQRVDYTCPIAPVVVGSPPPPGADAGPPACASPDPACTNCVVGIAGCTCAVPTPADGMVTATLCKGSPKDGPCSALANASLAASSIPTTVGDFTFTFPSSTKLDAGQAIWFRLTNESTQWAVRLAGGSGPSDFDAWLRSNYASTGNWVGASVEPGAKVTLLGCF